MSVLIEKIDKKIYKGEPPANVLNVDIKTKLNTVTIKWTDPEDTIIGGVSLSTWKGTILVRKKDSAPSNVNDGDILVDNTERNKYSINGYEDNNLEDGTYYYRFFIYSDTYIYNTDSNMIYNINIVNVDPILKNNSWETINKVAESGNASEYWKIGDEIDLVLSGTFNETVTLQIWDFNHFDKSDGSGKAGICFGMKHILTQDYMNTSDTNNGGWNQCYMKNTVINRIYNSIPIELRDRIKEVNTYANSGGENRDSGQGLLCTDKVFLPGTLEINYNSIDSIYSGIQNETEQGQKKFPIFTNYASRIKKLNNSSSSDAFSWWTRSPYYNSRDGFGYVFIDGKVSSTYAAYLEGVCFCFNI